MLKSNKLIKKNYLSSLDISSQEIYHILDLAKKFKNKDLNIKRDGKVLGLIFDNLQQEQE